jgi:hypothetical protein
LGLVGNNQTYLPTSQNNVVVNNILDGFYVDNVGGGHISQQDSPDVQWLRGMLAQTRSEYPIQRKPLADKAYRIRVSRVEVQNAVSGIHIVPDSPLTGLYYTFSVADGELTGTQGNCATTKGNSGTAAQWILLPAGDGDYQVLSAATNEVLGLSNGGATAILEPIVGTYDQRWLIRSVGDGRFNLRNRATGQLLSSLSDSNGCVDLVSSGTSENTEWLFTAH